MNRHCGGVLWTELRDSEGRSISGYTRADCDRITGNHLEITASWGGRSDLSALAGGPVRLHIEARDAKLYSIQFCL